jgi:hypothetical protein
MMELIKDNVTGKVTCLLGGVLWNNCTKDTDCPGRATCAINATWATEPAMCFCGNNLDWIGKQCESSKFAEDAFSENSRYTTLLCRTNVFAMRKSVLRVCSSFLGMLLHALFQVLHLFSGLVDGSYSNQASVSLG